MDLIIAIFMTLFELILFPEQQDIVEIIAITGALLVCNVLIVCQVEIWIAKYRKILKGRKRISYKERRTICQQ